jgi:hypothetical protein
VGKKIACQSINFRNSGIKKTALITGAGNATGGGGVHALAAHSKCHCFQNGASLIDNGPSVSTRVSVTG